MALICTLLLFNHVVEKQKYGSKSKERTAAKGSGKMVLHHVTIIPFNVFYMSKAM